MSQTEREGTVHIFVGKRESIQLGEYEMEVSSAWKIYSPYREMYLKSRQLINAGNNFLVEGKLQEASQQYSLAITNSPFFEFLPVRLIRKQYALEVGNPASKALYLKGLATATTLDMKEGAKSLELASSTERTIVPEIQGLLGHCYLFGNWRVMETQYEHGKPELYLVNPCYDRASEQQRLINALRHYSAMWGPGEENGRESNLLALEQTIFEEWTFLEMERLGYQVERADIQTIDDLVEKINFYGKCVKNPLLEQVAEMLLAKYALVHQSNNNLPPEERLEALRGAANNLLELLKQSKSSLVSVYRTLLSPLLQDGGDVNENVLKFIEMAKADYGKVGVFSCLAEFYELKGDYIRALEFYNKILGVEFGYSPGWINLFNIMLINNPQAEARGKISKLEKHVLTSPPIVEEQTSQSRSGAVIKVVRTKESEFTFFHKQCEEEEKVINYFLHHLLPERLKSFKSILEIPALVESSKGEATVAISNSPREFYQHIDKLIPRIVKVTAAVHEALEDIMNSTLVLGERRVNPSGYFNERDRREVQEVEECAKKNGIQVEEIRSILDEEFRKKDFSSFNEVWIKDIKPANWGYNLSTDKLIMFDFDYLAKRYPQWDWCKFIDNEFSQGEGMQSRFTLEKKAEILSQFTAYNFPNQQELAEELYYYCAFRKNFHSTFLFRSRKPDSSKACHRAECMFEALNHLQERGWNVKGIVPKLQILSP